MRLSVTTPRGAIVDTDVAELTAPGVQGEFGILPGHVPFLSALKPGVLVYRTADHVGVLAVGQGFLQVAPTGQGGTEQPQDRVLVLVDQAHQANAVDRAAAEKELTEADSELAGWKKELGGEYQALSLRRAWAQARLDALARVSPH